MPRRLTQGFLVAAALSAVCPADTMAVSGGAGVDYQAGPETQSYRGALLFATADATPGDLTLAAIRYKDSVLGPGTGGYASAGLILAPSLRFRVVGLRTLGDHGFDAWRLRGGPELKIASDVTLGAYYLRQHNDTPEDLDAMGLELSAPVMPGLSGQVGGSYGRWSHGAITVQGSVAATYRASARILLLCQADVGENVTTTSSSSASGGGIGSGLPLPLGGGGSGTETTTDHRITSAAQLGVRFLIP